MLKKDFHILVLNYRPGFLSNQKMPCKEPGKQVHYVLEFLRAVCVNKEYNW